jgi:hypothetical protein
MTTHHAGTFPRALSPQEQTQVKLAQLAFRQERLENRYFTALCFVLLGYALGGRGFAYWGVPPLFSGEVMLLIGVVVMLKSNVFSRVLAMRSWLPLIAFMVWGLIQTVPYIDRYKQHAIRDAVFWGYGTYAFIVATLLIANPIRVQKIVINYRKFVVWFLILAPVATVVVGFAEGMIPPLPFSGVPMIQVKGGDICVHLAGCFAYIVALGRGLNPWLISLFMPLNLGLNVVGRAGMVAFGSAVVCTMMLRPLHPRAMRIFFVIGLGLFFFWASDLKIEKGPREISFDGLSKAVMSIVQEQDDEALDGSKQWRMQWWGKIIDYTFHGKFFWTGKGFGINLASDDGFQTDASESLRSPHNGHLTALARAGVPGFVMWILIQVVFGYTIVRAYIRARMQKHMNWSGLFLFLGAYWGAFMANTTFDVFLEGPMGGIWFWCIYGAGIGSAYVYRRNPELLTPEAPPPATFPAIVPPAHAIRPH